MTNFWATFPFWIGILLLIAVALAFVLPPLLRGSDAVERTDHRESNVAIYRDQLADLKVDLEQGELGAVEREEACREIEKRLSEDVPPEPNPAPTSLAGRWAGYVLAAVIPVAAIVLYAIQGTPDALLITRNEATTRPEGQRDSAPMIAALEAKLNAKPDDAAGWHMLGLSYAALGRFDLAATALAKASELLPHDVDILADYADVLAITQDGNWAGKPQQLINIALKLNDQHWKVLALAGSAAFQDKNFAEAAMYWRRLLKILPPNSVKAIKIAEAAEAAERAAAGAPGPGTSNETTPDVTPKTAETGVSRHGGDAAISGIVILDDSLASKVAPTDKVFIFAQSAQGPKIPLAMLSIEASQLPYRFRLTDSMAMSPDERLSDHDAIMITARISRSGEAMAHRGDMQGKSGQVRVGQKAVHVIIDSVVP